MAPAEQSQENTAARLQVHWAVWAVDTGQACQGREEEGIEDMGSPDLPLSSDLKHPMLALAPPPRGVMFCSVSSDV